MAKERMPFELARPNAGTFVTKTSEIGHNGQPLDDALEGLDNISKQSTQSEEQAIIYETDRGVQVGKIDSTGADFANLKRGGQKVARMSDLPTKDSSITENPSTTNVPTTKAVKEYVDANAMGDLPISKESAQSEDEEFIASNDAGTDTYAKVGPYGMMAKEYLNMRGEPVIPVKDESIGEQPSPNKVPTSQAVADYVNARGGSHVSCSTTLLETSEVIYCNDDETERYVCVGAYGIKAVGYFDMQGNPIGGGSVSVQTISGKKYLVFG